MTTDDGQVDVGLPGGDNFYDVTQMFADVAQGKPSHDLLSVARSPWRRKICLLGDSS